MICKNCKRVFTPSHLSQQYCSGYCSQQFRTKKYFLKKKGAVEWVK